MLCFTNNVAPKNALRFVLFVQYRVNLELFKAKDIMSRPVYVLHATESVAALAKVLTETDHGGFPIVKYNEETRLELAYGLITRYALAYYYAVI